MSIDPRVVLAICLTAWGLLSGCRAAPPSAQVVADGNTPTSPANRTPVATSTATPAPPSYLRLVQRWRHTALETVWDMAAADLDGDGHSEVLAASHDKGVYALTGAGALLWRFAAGAGVYSVDAGDLDGDGKAEVAAGSDDNHVYLLAGDGGLLWSGETGSRVPWVAISQLIDGAPLVLAGSWDGHIYGFDVSGDLTFEASLGSGVQAVSIGAAATADGAQLLVKTAEGEVLALSSSGEAIWTEPGAVAAFGAAGGTVGPQVLLASEDGMLRAVEADGAVRPLGRYGESTPVLAAPAGPDFPAAAIGTGGDSGEVVGLDEAGRPLWRFPVGSSVWALQIVDLDGDGAGEVIAGGDDGWLRVFDSYGRLVGAARTDGRVRGVVASDLDGDGRPEIVARSGSHVYGFAWNSVIDPPQVTTGGGPRTLEDPWSADLPRPPEAPAAELLFVGDVFPCRTVEERMVRFGAGYPFRGTQPLLQAADLAIGNLECPLSLRGAPIAKRFLFRAQPDLSVGLVEAGLDVVTLANNHVLDFGPDAFRDTLARVDSLGLLRVGAGGTAQMARQPLEVEVRGVRLVFLNYAALRWRGSNEVPTLDLVSFAEVDRIRQEVAAAAVEADHVIVIMHLGTEYQVAPDAEQLAVARAAVEAGAGLVVGHHSHVVQPTAVYLDGLIAYGLGNFVFDIDILERAREGAMLRVFFSREGMLRAEMIPVRIVDDVQPRLLLDDEGRVRVEQVYP